MNYRAQICFLLMLILSTTGYAASNTNYWRCSTQDGTNREWSATNIYEKIALNFAFDRCKKESKVPNTCRTAQNNCEQFINGVSSRPLWQCTALDRTAQPWRSRIYSQRDDAALAAKAFCQQKSTLPETCYVNMITCVNKNGPMF